MPSLPEKLPEQTKSIAGPDLKAMLPRPLYVPFVVFSILITAICDTLTWIVVGGVFIMGLFSPFFHIAMVISPILTSLALILVVPPIAFFSVRAYFRAARKLCTETMKFISTEMNEPTQEHESKS